MIEAVGRGTNFEQITVRFGHHLISSLLYMCGKRRVPAAVQAVSRMCEQLPLRQLGGRAGDGVPGHSNEVIILFPVSHSTSGEHPGGGADPGPLRVPHAGHPLQEGGAQVSQLQL